MRNANRENASRKNPILGSKILPDDCFYPYTDAESKNVIEPRRVDQKNGIQAAH
jgi:hypothetical protein